MAQTKPEDDHYKRDLEARIRPLLSMEIERPPRPPLPPASEMSPEEAANELWERHLLFEYDNYQEYFARWWSSLKPEERERLNINVENFPTYDDWMRAWMPAHVRMLADDQFYPPIEARARLIFSRLPHVSLDEVKEAIQDREKASKLRDRYREAAALLGQHLGLTDGRPIKNADRDRQWSKLWYQGVSEKDILLRYFYKCGLDTIRKAIQAHRNRNRSLHWALRISIFITGFPPAGPASSREWLRWWQLIAPHTTTYQPQAAGK